MECIIFLIVGFTIGFIFCMIFKRRDEVHGKVEIEPSTGKHITVYHLERFLPVFSHRFFGTKGIDPVYNYEYFSRIG